VSDSASEPEKDVLVVLTAEYAEDVVRREIAAIGAANVRVISPASKLSKLDWLANDEDRERANAERRAVRAAQAVEPVAASADGGAGDSNVVLAISDALREFPADEILIVTPPEEEQTWLESGAAAEAMAHLDIPVRHVVVARS
jgi:hypothetical protein